MREQDLVKIDVGAKTSSIGRTQFVLNAALKKTRKYLLGQVSLSMDAASFQKILERMDEPASPQEIAGIRRLRSAKAF